MGRRLDNPAEAGSGCEGKTPLSSPPLSTQLLVQTVNGGRGVKAQCNSLKFAFTSQTAQSGAGSTGWSITHS